MWSVTASFYHFGTVDIGNPCRDPQGISIIYIALIYFSEWSGDDGLNFNPKKCTIAFSPLRAMMLPTPISKLTLMVMHYPRLSRQLTLVLHSLAC